jgi:hypothetical protein
MSRIEIVEADITTLNVDVIRQRGERDIAGRTSAEGRMP